MVAMHKRFRNPEEIGTPIESVIRREMKDPEYLKYYLLYRVRVAIAMMVKLLRATIVRRLS